MESLPQSTALVLVEYSLPNKRNQAKDWLSNWAKDAKELAFVRDFPSPKGAQMVKWIQEKANQRGGRFAPQAATLLASLVGEDTRLADQEIVKLLDFVDYARPVETEDVNELCPYVGILADFALVNAIRERDSRQALSILTRELEKKEPLFLFQSIVSLFRELLMTRDVLDRGGGQPEIVKELKDLNVSSGRAYHLLRQANGFTTPELISIYHQLLGIDEAIKTSQMSAEAVLEIFLASFTLQQPTHR
jgi:DNA polymerase-3 subunit delta